MEIFVYPRSCLAAIAVAAALALHPVGAQVAIGEELHISPTQNATVAKRSETQLRSLRDLFEALHRCVEPPALERAHHDAQIAMRFALNRDGRMIAPPFVTFLSPDVRKETRDVYVEAVKQSLDRCMPLPLTKEFASAIAGTPINFRLTGDRNDRPQ